MRPWISEMYGYSYGSAKAGVWHKAHHTGMLYPGYDMVGKSAQGGMVVVVQWCRLAIVACGWGESYRPFSSLCEVGRAIAAPPPHALLWHAYPRTQAHARTNDNTTRASPRARAEAPYALHYGLVFDIPDTGFKFDKHWYNGFDATQCPPWDLHPGRGDLDRARSGGLFPHPPRPSVLKSVVRALSQHSTLG